MNLAKSLNARAMSARAAAIDKEYEDVLNELVAAADKGDTALNRRTPHEITIKKLENVGFVVRVSGGHCVIQFY